MMIFILENKEFDRLDIIYCHPNPNPEKLC
jgi:hypothetical protein